MSKSVIVWEWVKNIEKNGEMVVTSIFSFYNVFCAIKGNFHH